MILQGWGWGESGGAKNLDRLPRPDYRELRFMTYDSIICGATGIDWHTEGGKGHGVCNETDSEYWRDFAFVNQELAEVGRRLAGSIPGKKKLARGGVVCQTWTKGGETVVIALNENSMETLPFVFPELAGAFYRTLSGEKVAQGQSFIMKPYDVLIFTTTPIKLCRPNTFAKKPHADKAFWKKANLALDADWIRTGKRTKGSEYLKVACTLDTLPKKAMLNVIASPEWRLSINGRYAEGGIYHFIGYQFDVTRFLKEGANEFVFEMLWRPGKDKCAAMVLTDENGRILARTDKNAQWSLDGKGEWLPAIVIGKHGPACPDKAGRGTYYVIEE